MSQLTIVPIAVVLLGSMIAVITDVWKYKVYNLLTVPLLLSGLFYYTATAGWSGLRASAAGMAVGFIAFIVPYLFGIMGAGDVKLMAALGAWLGVPATSAVILIGCVITIAYSIGVLLLRGGMNKVWENIILSYFRVHAVIRHMAPDDEYETIQTIAQKKEQRGRLIPFSVMIGLGVVVSLLFLRAF
jgi:prepilin peptidase CpaA